MKFIFKPLALALTCALALSVAWSLRGAAADLTGTPAILYSLDKLNVLGSVLMIGAHPDDENTAVVAYLARGRKISTGYLSLTRGEGGQNLLGNEQNENLGVLRTQELLAARQIDGASQYFTRAIDFGFTKTVSETMEKWGHDRILADVVWVVRQQRPDVIVLCFSGTPADGHGQHQVSAILGREAFDAAADPAKFPEQLKWVKPWRATRVVQARYNLPGGAPGASGGSGRAPIPVAGTVELPVGDYNPTLGRSYRELAVLSRDQHKSQAMVQLESFGAQANAMLPVAGTLPVSDLMDGIDITWNRIPGGAPVGRLLADARRNFDDLHPEKTVAALLDARSLITALKPADGDWAAAKLKELDHAIALCAGLRVEAQADSPAYVPGSTAEVKLTAINRSSLPMTLSGVSITGWNASGVTIKSQPLPNNREQAASLKITVPRDTPPSQPFWLVHPKQGDTYDIPDQALIGRADIIPQVSVRFDLTVDGRPFAVTEPLHYRYADPARDEFVRPIVVEPPVSVELPATNFVLTAGAPKEIDAIVRAMIAGQAGKLVFEAPQGWSVEPASAEFDLKDAGATQEVKFRIVPPPTPGAGDFRVVANLSNGSQVTDSVNIIDYPHIPAQSVFRASGGRMASVQMKVLARRVGYVMGSDDRMPEAIRQMGCQVDLLDETALTTGDLGVYDAIVTGLRAYAVRADLRAAQRRLLAYVNNGGTLVVQYNRLDDRRISPSVADAFDHLGPYPFVLSQGNTQRVTEEDAPVKFLDPASPILNFPNRITAEDFAGWVQERGIYFADTWDAKYQTPFETHDTGDKDLKGSLLYTRYGKGAYIYTSFSWFREMPAGVPGAFRIFANLLSAGQAPR